MRHTTTTTTLRLPAEHDLPFVSRPYVNHAVQLKPRYTRRERFEQLHALGLNVFDFPAEMVTGCDLLSDSGTTAMTNEQWAALHHGDESYGSNRGYFLLGEQIRATFGEEFFAFPGEGEPCAFLFHQGRAAEHALFSVLARRRAGMIVPSNGHFDTTRANLELQGIRATDLFSPALRSRDQATRFQGNMDVERLGELLERHGDAVPLVMLTITNNTGGGHPVSMENIRAVSRLARQHGKPLLLDACRFAENAWFIRRYEPGYGDATIEEIVHEAFSLADGFLVSFKKDGMVNMGGGLFLRQDGAMQRCFPGLCAELTDAQVAREGNPTYGGLSGRDIMALVHGLRTSTDLAYLGHRIGQVRALGEGLARAGVPVSLPTGGHAVYIEIDQFFADTDMRREDFGGVALSASLLAAYGHRTCELGAFSFGKVDPSTGQDVLPELNYLRLAVPRLRYEQQDLDAVACAIGALHRLRHAISPVDIVYGRELSLRHFKARLRFRDPEWARLLADEPFVQERRLAALG